MKDPFANYVVQFLLEKKDFTINKRIADQLKGSYLELSTEKFSSNVIEKVRRKDKGLVSGVQQPADIE